MIIQWPRLWLLWNHSSFFRSLPCGEWELFGVLGYDSGAPLDHQGGHICSEQDSWVFLVGAGRGWTLSFSLFLLDRAHSKRQKHWNIINSFLISLSPLFETRIPRSKERLFDYYRNRTDTAPHHTISPGSFLPLGNGRPKLLEKFHQAWVPTKMSWSTSLTKLFRFLIYISTETSKDTKKLIRGNMWNPGPL